MLQILTDIRLTVRSFVRHPGSTVSILSVLGVGIGSVTLMFSVLNTAVLRPLPYEEPDELVWVWATSQRWGNTSMSFSDLADFRAGTSAFESFGGLTAFQDRRFITGRDDSERVSVGQVTANLFSTLGVRPELGRTFRPEEEESDIETVTILSHALWMRQFGGDPAAVGSVLSLDDRPVEVVGVMPAWFDLPAGSDLWVPIQQGAGYSQGRGNNNYVGVARLKEATSIRQAQLQIDAVAAGIAEAFPDVKADRGALLMPLHERFFSSAREVLLVLLGIVTLVPVVACANAASLLLAKAAERTTEMASRMALGASRAQLARKLLTENLVLASAGGVLGLGLAWMGGVALSSLAPEALPRLREISIDGTVVTFTVLVSILTVPLFAVLPVIKATDVSIAETLKAAGGGRIGGGRSVFLNALVATQVAVSLVLLAGSGLLLKSYRNLQHQDLGFPVEDLRYASIDLPPFKYRVLEFEDFGRREAAWADVFRSLNGLPGVEKVGAIDQAPLTQWGPTNEVWAAERPPADRNSMTEATRRYVNEDYFEVAGVPLISGRVFEVPDGEDPELDPPVIINEALANQYFPGEDPLGKILVFDYDVHRNLEIIGVVGNVKEGDPASDPRPVFYVPARWRPTLSMTVLFRPTGPTTDLSPALRQAVRALDPDIPVPTMETMEDRLASRLFQPRFRSTLVGSFSFVTLLLSILGLYGVLSFFARSRRRETSIRRVLGATGIRTGVLVFRRGMILVGAGVLVGLAASLVGARVIQGWLFGVGTMDPAILGIVTVVLLAASSAACLVPSLRAVTVNPVEVLREE